MTEIQEKKDQSGAAAKPPLFSAASICILAAAFIVFMIVFIKLVPMKRYNESEIKLIAQRSEVAKLQAEKESEQTRMRNQEQIMARLRERKAGFDLWSFVNTTLTETKLKDRANLEAYKPRSDRRTTAEDVSMVQLRLTGVTLAELVDFLYKVYASNELVVMYRLEYLRASNDNKGLECNVVFLTPKA